MIPADWLRLCAPTRAASFFAHFNHGVLRAAFDLAMLVAAVELVHLACFLTLHRQELARIPQSLADQEASDIHDT